LKIQLLGTPKGYATGTPQGHLKFLSVVLDTAKWKRYIRFMDYKAYHAEYQKIAAEMQSALAEFNTAQGRVMVLQKKMAALSVLMGLSKPLDELSLAQRQDIETAEKVMHATSKAADSIRRVFLATPDPLTTKDIREKLRKSGYDLTQHKNVGAMIDAVCKRLADQGFLRPVVRNGPKAWEKII
jgi:hypothetical protein